MAEAIVSEKIRDGSGHDVMVGDLNTRHTWWDSCTNEKLKALQVYTGGNQFYIKDPSAPRLEQGDRTGTSIAYLMLKKIGSKKR